MGFLLHIERRNVDGDLGEPITLEEWKQAVSQCPNARLITAPITERDTHSHEERVVFVPKDGDVMISAGSEEWCIHWDYGSACLRPPDTFGMPDDPFMPTLRALSKSLDARLVDDDGEVYD